MVNEARRVFANRLLHALAPLALLVILLAPTNAAGQAATGTVSGTVTDQSGGVIDAARVTMVNLGTGMQREAATGSEGQFVVPLLPPGTYKLAVLRDGFSPAEVNPVVVKGGEQVALQIQMKVESLSEAVVVTAQKRGEERLQEVPIPVTVVNPEALAETGQNRLRDYYASLPGVVLRPIPGTGQSNWLTVRGVPPIGTIPTVGIVIDDVPFGSPAVFSAGHQPVPDIDPGDLARIEVLRGPQGTLYGASGMGGLLNFVTAEPSTDSLSGRVQLGLGGVYNGSEPAYSFRGSVNLPVNDVLAIRASAFTRHDPGYIDNPLLGTGGVNEAAVAGGRVSALWKMTDTASVRFSALYENTDRKGLNDIVLKPGLADLQQDYAPGIGTVTAEVQAYSARIKANLGRANITSITAYNAFAQEDSLETSALYGNATRDIYGSAIAATLSTRRTKKFVQEVRFLVPVGRSLDFMTGTYYTHEDTHTAQLIRVLDPAGHAIGLFSDRQIPSDYDEYAGFATVTYRVSSRFDIQSGLRHSTIRQSVAESYTGPFVPIFLRATSPFVSERRDVDEGLVSYLLTPRFRATSNVMAYARFASGYRPGSLNLGVSPSYAAAGVPYGFAHDQTRDYDIGLKAEFFDRALAIDASLYYIDWNDVQLNVQLTSAETNQAIAYRVNGGNAKSAGAELSVEARPFERTTVTGWIAYNDAKLTDDFPANRPLYGRAGDRLPIGTRLSGFVSARQDVRLWAGATGVISGQASLVGDRLGGFQVLSAGAAPPRNRYPSYAQVDVRAGIEQSSWSANVHVNNLLDERGLLGGGPGDGFPANAFIYISPRAVGLSITRTF